MSNCPSWRGALLLACAAPMAAPGVAAAQAGSSIIDQNRVDRAAPAPLKQEATPALPGASIPAAAFAPFVLRQVRIDGSSLSPAVLTAAYRPFVGADFDPPALARLMTALLRAYAASDIALYSVTAPQQDFADGVLRLRAIEGRVAGGAVYVDGDQKVLARIRPQVAKLTGQRPLSRAALERRLSLIRDLPGVTAQADMQRTATQGDVRLAIDARQKPHEFGAAVTSRGTAALGRTQVTLDAAFYGLLRGGDATRLTVAVPTDIERFQYYALSHSQMAGEDGAVVTGAVGYLRTRPSGTSIHGRATLASLQAAYPLVRGYDRSLYLTGSLDGLDSRNAQLGRTIANERTRAARAGLAYARTTARTTVGASLSVSHGIDGLGARALDPRITRLSFEKVNFQASLDRQLAPAWIARLRVAGQASGDALPAAELFSLGGDSFGRAFESSFLSGDRGYAGSAELAWRPVMPVQRLQGSELYAFADDGAVRLAGRLGPAARYRIASGGGGVRIATGKPGVVQLEAARALADTTPADRHAWRLTAAYRTAF